MSTRPTVPSDPKVPSDRRPVTIPSLFEMKRAGTPIVMVTAYDYPSARAADRTAPSDRTAQSDE